jgi:putative methionine-R-sulfoxide reductase with GAF domain
VTPLRKQAKIEKNYISLKSWKTPGYSKMDSITLFDMIHKSKTNPYFLWPSVTTEKATRLRFSQLKQDEASNMSFYFERNEVVYLYFQVQNLEWDSNHFGYKCAVIKHFYISDDVDFKTVEEMAEHINPMLKQYVENTHFLSSDIPSQSSNGNFFIQLLGFKFILNWIDGFWLASNIKNENTNLEVGVILPEEVDMICNIAANSYYRGGRFYSDKTFIVSDVDRLYGALVRNSFINNEIIIVCREDNKPIGVFICKPIKYYPDLSDIKVAHLRFLVVDPNHRGNMFGYNIFKSTLAYLYNKCDLITSGLESHNLVSLNIHVKLGFKVNYSHNAYHLWNKV